MYNAYVLCLIFAMNVLTYLTKNLFSYYFEINNNYSNINAYLNYKVELQSKYINFIMINS